VTYNFDIDRWYRMRRDRLQARLESGELNELDYEHEISDLDRRYEEIQDRLDGSFQMPDPSGKP
jgi:hypothetical protein